MIATAELSGLESLWEEGLSEPYTQYLSACAQLPEARREALALAGALVEVALAEQRLGLQAAAPPTLLIADLCLARASRILAESASTETQITFARTVEDAAMAAAEGIAQSVRGRILEALKAAR